MANNIETLNREMFELLQSNGYEPKAFDTEGSELQTPDEAALIRFKKPGTEDEQVRITINTETGINIYYSESTGDGNDKSWKNFLRLIKKWAMRKQQQFNLKNTERLKYDMARRQYAEKKEKLGEGRDWDQEEKDHPMNNKELRKKYDEYVKQQDVAGEPHISWGSWALYNNPNRKSKKKVEEGYHAMGNKASYNDNIPAVKIILQHNRKIEEGEQRYRNVAKIFLENQLGERFLAPTTRPGIAQIYARHLAEGGVPNDERWNHIKSLCEEYSKMAGFVRATKNKQFNESAQQLVSEGINHYQSLRETLGKLRGHRGYNQYFESWTPALMEDGTSSDLVSKINDFLDNSDTGNDPHYASWLRDIIKNPNINVVKKEIINFADELNRSDDREWLKSIVANSDSTINELFVQETVDPRIESVMPILSRLHKKEKPVKEIKELEEWANQIAEGDGLQSSNPQGTPEAYPDVMRHTGDKTIRVVKKGGKPVGEIGIDTEASPGNGQYYVKLYDGSYDAAGFDTEEEALAELKYAVKHSVTESGCEVEEGLDADQKRAGQLGPTEKVGKEGAVGKLVGANESKDDLEDIKRLLK
jgi:hypothetical protein